MKIGQKIKEYRERKGLSQQGLATEIGVVRAAINNWESGRNRPAIHLLYPLAQALEVDLTFLLKDEDKKSA